MSRLQLSLLFVLAVGVAIGAPVGLPSFDVLDGEVGGKYLTDGGGYLRISVDDLGRVQGYYERDDAFGEFSGHFDGKTIRGYWLQDEGSDPCVADRAGFANWGRVALTFANASEFSGKFGACAATPIANNTWSGRKQP